MDLDNDFQLPDLSIVTTRFSESLAQKRLRPVESVLQLRRRKGFGRDAGGVFALYYHGGYGPYQPLAEAGAKLGLHLPIYVGSTRQQGSRAVLIRLARHCRRLESAHNLRVSEFSCRLLFVPRNWVAQAKDEFEERLQPLWNTLITGFGSNSQGRHRSGQRRSAWDILHRTGGGSGRGPDREAAELEALAHSYLCQRVQVMLCRPSIEPSMAEARTSGAAVP